MLNGMIVFMAFDDILPYCFLRVLQQFVLLTDTGVYPLHCSWKEIHFFLKSFCSFSSVK